MVLNNVPPWSKGIFSVTMSKDWFGYAWSNRTHFCLSMDNAPRFNNLISIPPDMKVNVIYYGVLTTKSLEDRKFQFVYIFTLFMVTHTQFIRKQSSKLQFLSWLWQFDRIFFHLFDFLLCAITSFVLLGWNKENLLVKLLLRAF
jgi:hypothetical protein